jgi:ribosome-associated protein
MTDQWMRDLIPYVRAIRERKSMGIVALDVRELTSVADTFIVCSGRSNRQVSAISEHVRFALRAGGLRPLHVEGEKEGHWVLLDYGHVVIHVFYEPVRSFYDLESLWADAPRIDLEALSGEKETK